MKVMNDTQQNNVQSNDYIPQNSDAQALDETLADLVSEVSDLGSEFIVLVRCLVQHLYSVSLH